ncbi:sulfotransferase family 2 domain-containing protein [Actibacterium ureilyticum]|uniref:sulfotransferase family 2 domain-containing protein n=1 Tax=Actibacterium ureilyticum TaxID=1590614 RepID=UPI000BAAD073|nr:sulfotransferase family 2 domain-containing protein [Actibacterium ureilyticum]
MIISHGRRYIFVHIPKTGGTAMALALEQRAMADDILIGDTPKALRRRRRVKTMQAAGRLWKHARLRDIDGLVTPQQVASYFVFTLVRNPWDRMVSYYHWLQAQSFDHAAVSLAQSLSFADFVAHPQIGESIRAGPYGSYVQDTTGAERCDAFIRLECLEADLAPLERHLGFPVALTPGVNASDRARDYRRYYDAATYDRVGRICAADIARFGYSGRSDLSF